MFGEGAVENGTLIMLHQVGTAVTPGLGCWGWVVFSGAFGGGWGGYVGWLVFIFKCLLGWLVWLGLLFIYEICTSFPDVCMFFGKKVV